MRKFLKLSLTSMLLAGVATSAITVIATTDYAYAKNGNGAGNGNGGGNSGGNSGGGGKGGGNSGGKGNGAGKSSDQGGKSAGQAKGGKSSSNGKSTKTKGGKERTKFGEKLRNGPLKGLFKKKTTTVKAAQNPTKKVTRTAAQKKERPAQKQRVAKADDPLHPSNLGKLNGALNSNPRAKEAHIANGNYLKGTGPVSLAAALAVVDHDLAAMKEAAAAVEAAEKLVELEAAHDLVENKPTPEEIEAAQSVIDDPDATEEQIAEAEDVLDYPDTSEAEALIDGQERPTAEELAEAEEVIEEGGPSEEDIAAAEEGLGVVEDALLDAYKGDLSDADREKVLDAVRASNPDPETVAGLLEDAEAEEEAPDPVDTSEAPDEDGLTEQG